MPTVGVALFGVGRAGGIHFPNLASNNDVSIRWLVDVTAMKDKALMLCTKYGVDTARFLSVEDSQKVFDDEETHAVIIGTPTRFHEELIKRAVRAGKDVFCEKPITFSTDAVVSCYAEAQKYGRILFCGFNRRFDADHIRLREKVQSGQLGNLRFVHYMARDCKQVSDYIRTSGGIFIDSAIHMLDYVPWLVGEKPSSLVVTGSCTSSVAAVYEQVDDVDSTIINLQFPSGCYAVLEITRELPAHFVSCYHRYEVVGTEDCILMHKTNDNTLISFAMDGSDRQEQATPSYWCSYKMEMDCFIRVVQGLEECPLTPESVIQAHALAELCRTSLKEQRFVSAEDMG
ncbi:uncharacterized protein LOC112571048 [Pomacea canaliculata]|nr:uncharacterized protein LOC112571048 [Pomacea canaliculata]XP_025105625.1 uncharacterized protein LOC112571048 [Pomacea canaliculata]XP_025105626.1 uncharacterized protein LOC112571048 [Pomacea canaliculata]